MAKVKVPKGLQVQRYLQKHGSITSKEAIEKFWETRLSAVIYAMKKDGFIIETEREDFVDRNGYENHYARYIYLGKKDNKPSKMEVAYAKKVERAEAKEKEAEEKKQQSAETKKQKSKKAAIAEDEVAPETPAKVPAKHRGRPPKDKADTAPAVEQPAKRRGRPPKSASAQPEPVKPVKETKTSGHKGRKTRAAISEQAFIDAMSDFYTSAKKTSKKSKKK